MSKKKVEIKVIKMFSINGALFWNWFVLHSSLVASGLRSTVLEQFIWDLLNILYMDGN